MNYLFCLSGWSAHALCFNFHFTCIERKIAATSSAGSIKLPSPAPVASSAYNAVGQRSRLSQQVHPRPSPLRSRRVTASAGLDADEDAEGEEDLEDATEEGGDAEDKELYCFCQKLSYGEVRVSRSALRRTPGGL